MGKSPISRAEAESLGWVIVHEDEGKSVEINDPQHGDENLAARLPSYRAEKYVDTPLGPKLINEQAESEGKLLERIYAYEQNQEKLSGSIESAEAPIDEDIVPLDTDGLPLRSVIGPGGVRLTEAEWSSRDKSDAIYDGEKMVYQGPHDVAVEADEARQELSANLENEDKAEEDVGPTEQIEYDTADSIDSPGQSAGGVVVVRKGESLEDVSVRRDSEKADAESERVNAAIEASNEQKAAEESKGEPEDEAQPDATPAAVDLAEEQGVDLSDVDGSGKDGKILKPDVEQHLDAENDPED